MEAYVAFLSTTQTVFKH